MQIGFSQNNSFFWLKPLKPANTISSAKAAGN
jgi:hypothetical protein